eukprot:CAMPEP_0196677790 /NCGR_PEP_ID=MMETSP1090-20130531/5901_1 /TAXON_ID=37098 /ORGANISM="Isochrysis sp, Strain CCMP1244" /LENGTH=62 /DNA_ID=CAMNT_0042015903 /DNA_START=494 /DNA_END=682 /DNA_ORIENTATION=+
MRPLVSAASSESSTSSSVKAAACALEDGSGADGARTAVMACPELRLSSATVASGVKARPSTE